MKRKVVKFDRFVVIDYLAVKPKVNLVKED